MTKKSSLVSGYSNALLCCVFSLRSTEKGADYGKQEKRCIIENAYTKAVG